MKMPFWKIAASGNDFVIVNNFAQEYQLLSNKIKKLCTRRTGIGADGLLLLQISRQKGHDFRMQYFNADGNETEMCGNGARAISYFHHKENGGEKKNYTFETQNGIYFSQVQDNFVKVQMTEVFDAGSITVDDLVDAKWGHYINTGVPHCVYEVKCLDHYDVSGMGRTVRHDKRFEKGVNCSFFEKINHQIHIRTFERGVEEETLACGTGVMAVALSLYLNGDRRDIYECYTPGGEISIEVESLDKVYLGGKVEKVFEGELDI